jgi:hypothetical protein
MFHRKVLKADDSVETSIELFQDGAREDVGIVKFPNKQTWTKFWGAIQRGAIHIQDLEVHMENVPDEEPSPTSKGNEGE